MLEAAEVDAVPATVATGAGCEAGAQAATMAHAAIRVEGLIERQSIRRGHGSG